MDEALQEFEQKACAMSLSSGRKKATRNCAGESRSGGARFFAGRQPLREPIAWHRQMNSQEELDQAFDLRANTFIRHATQSLLSLGDEKPAR